MRFEWTPEGYQRVLTQGLDPAEIHRALSGPGPRLLEPVADDMLSVLVHAAAGELIEVWLQEDPDDGAREVFAAFDAGFLGKAKWTNAFEQGER
ncbi:MAG TPA: hypothetical protein VFM54_10655 [Micromonosporaceae bacterium]|nr:hypothetical protein [Micromonosporaceae bacterium]